MAVSSETTNDLMAVFSNTVTSGFAALAGPVNGIFGLMIALVVALTGIQWAVSSNRDALAGAFSKILLIGTFAYIINDWQGLSETIFAGFLQLGLTAGGGSISSADFLNPGAVIETGWQIVKALGEAPTTTENPLDVIGNLIDAIIIGISMLGIMIAFAVLALQIIVTLLEFKIVTLGGFILLPFGILSKTAFMAERPLGYVVSSGLKVLALAIVISGAQAVFAQLTPSPEPDIYEAMTILTAAIILAMLSLFAPNLAAALVSGGPALGAGALAVGGLAVGGAAGMAAAGVANAGAAAAGAASGAGSQIASSARAAAGAGTGRPPQNPGGGSNGSSPAGSGPKGGAPNSAGNSASLSSSNSGNGGSASSFWGKNSGQEVPIPGNGDAAYPKRGKNLPGSTAGSSEGSAQASPSPESATSADQGSVPSQISSSSASQSGNMGSAASPQSGNSPTRYHRFPAHNPQSHAGRSKALSAYFAANTARQLLPANENSGSLSPSIREED
ncbi:P-type conjugative transfer protein TrbL [Aquidulcibacter sp.]|uniref:P-type conjugative transfer protein TrbL n=1 Tax=Aquidulcibacter sp. TaxID=2052990 RepID=UPI0025B7E3EB|nr:P-type conjugative transfer protein TrbL [Aquidulcibacter sp.]MCA3697733.1 P-type conjugative transfer protein TrbL [Aquidulcibacter sp.]